MYKFFKDKTLITCLICVQMLVIIAYVYFEVAYGEESPPAVTFIQHITHDVRPAYKTISKTGFHLRKYETHDIYMDFNSSLCYKYGTDMNSMSNKWQCKCLPGWHGKDCGQPEIIMRAFLKHRKRIAIKGPRLYRRRIIYAFSVDEFSGIMLEMRLLELADIIDLFVLNRVNNSGFGKEKLNNFLREFQHKIVFLDEQRDFYNLLKNLQDDDIVLASKDGEIPNKKILDFVKNYDDWPEPLRFRIRWSVFGFFWLHPSKTTTTGGLSTVSYLKKKYNGNFSALIDNRTNNGLIIGDLNHFGGWYCQFCMEPHTIMQYIIARKEITFKDMDRKKIDVQFVEELIENGLYIDGKTELVRSRKYQDKYFAPGYVMEHEWKFDFLTSNFYTKVDYYEG